ncbi:MAG: hypothetical protein ACRD2O_13960 [Terriglobia bacterium]
MMNKKVSWGALLCLIAAITFSGCTSNSQNTHSQNQHQQDEKERQRVANATQKVKERSDQAAQKIDAASQKLEHKAAVAAQGIKEGWNRGSSRVVDINSASQSDLQGLGLSEKEAKQVIVGRPYKSKRQLTTRGILSQKAYRRIEERIAAD